MACCVCNASPLHVILVDHLGLGNVYDTAAGPLSADELRGSVVALVSPGLPRGADPVANLYATVSAGDQINTSNDYNGLLQRDLFAAGADQDVTIEEFGDVSNPKSLAALRSRIETIRASSTKSASAPGIMLVGVVPTDNSPRPWDSLTPIVWISCGRGSTDASLQPTLSSDTTQTAGLISLRDIAPTILQAEGAPIPDSMSGHAAHVVFLGSSRSRDQMLVRMDDLVRTNQRGLTPFGWTYGIVAGMVFFISIFQISAKKPRFSLVLRFVLRMVIAMPLALMIAPLGYVADVPGYLTEILAVDLIFAAIPSVGALVTLIAVAITLDAYTGTTLVSRSMLSGYWLSGIRFYGIGNEYMGILIGTALTGWAILINKDENTTQARISALLAAWFMVVLIALSYPQFGAKAGGAVTATAAFLPCWLAVSRGKKITFWNFVLSVAIGFSLVFAMSAVAHHFGSRETHIQAATTALQHGRLGYIAHVAVRKAKMAVKVALMPGTLTAIICLFPIIFFWRRAKLRPMVATFLSKRRIYGVALTAGLWGMLAAALFNDSGSVAALLLFGTLVLPLLHEMLGTTCESLPSTSVMSESESPSATNLNSAPIPLRP